MTYDRNNGATSENLWTSEPCNIPLLPVADNQLELAWSCTPFSDSAQPVNTHYTEVNDSRLSWASQQDKSMTNKQDETSKERVTEEIKKGLGKISSKAPVRIQDPSPVRINDQNEVASDQQSELDHEDKMSFRK